jgi:hypothetical protein
VIVAVIRRLGHRDPAAHPARRTQRNNLTANALPNPLFHFEIAFVVTQVQHFTKLSKWFLRFSFLCNFHEFEIFIDYPLYS